MVYFKNLQAVLSIENLLLSFKKVELEKNYPGKKQWDLRQISPRIETSGLFYLRETLMLQNQTQIVRRNVDGVILESIEEVLKKH